MPSPHHASIIILIICIWTHWFTTFFMYVVDLLYIHMQKKAHVTHYVAAPGNSYQVFHCVLSTCTLHCTVNFDNIFEFSINKLVFIYYYYICWILKILNAPRLGHRLLFWARKLKVKNKMGPHRYASMNAIIEPLIDLYCILCSVWAIFDEFFNHTI